MKPTRAMIEAERRVGMPIREYMMQAINGGSVYDGTFIEMAEVLGISIGMVTNWMLKMGIGYECVAVKPGDRVYAVDLDGRERLALTV